MANKFKVVYPYVRLRMRAKDSAEPWVSREFYAGALLDTEHTDIEPDDLRRHLDDGMVAPEGSPEAEVMGVPAGTPIPGEPPNVPVAEASPALDMGSRIENALEAAGVKRSARRSEDGRPSQADSKADWVKWRVAQRGQGVSEDEARAKYEAMSKADLMAEKAGRAADGGRG